MTNNGIEFVTYQDLTPIHLSSIRLLLRSNPRLTYIFESGLVDLRNEITHRRYKLSQCGLVMRANFAGIDVFYTAGHVEPEDIEWMFSFGDQAEIHCLPSHEPSIVSLDLENRIVSVLRLANAYECATSWRRRRPTL